MNALFNRSPRFLRLFDAACAIACSFVAWRTGSFIWVISALVSAVLCATGASVVLQEWVQRGMRGAALALTIRRGV